MKKLLLLLLLIPFLNFANLKGTVFMNDGSVKIGFIKLPDTFDSTLKFRLEKKGPAEKLSINDVKEFEITTDEGAKIKYVALFLSTVKSSDELDLKVRKEKSWFQVMREGKYSMLTSAMSSTPMVGASGMSIPGSGGSEASFYLRKGTDDKAIHFDTVYGGLTFCPTCFKQMHKTLAAVFKNDCPELAEKVTKELLKKEGHTVVLDIYEMNCGK